ncbi:MAG: sodium/proton-translocating pyrophosphatase, partial [Candidatus Thermoplasmatota archaeon]
MVDLTFIVPFAGLAAIGAAAYLAMSVLKLPEGDEAMRKIARRIQEGARAFMRRQYRTIAVISAIVAIIFACAIGLFSSSGGLFGS